MVIRDIIAIARPRHYVKNLFIFTPLFFGGKLLDVGSFDFLPNRLYLVLFPFELPVYF